MVNVVFPLGRFANILISLYCLPYRPEELKAISIFPSFPGASGFLSYSTVVHPQLLSMALITKFSLPVFLK